MVKKVPSVRFKGFSKEWEKRRLGDLTENFKSGMNIKAEYIYKTGDFPVYGGNDVRGYTDTYNHDGEFALIGRQGALSGNMNYSVGKAYFTEHAIAVKANKENETKYLYYLMSKLRLERWVTQSAQPGLAVGTLKEIKSLVPNKDEQKKISKFLTKLDDTIELHQHALNLLKQRKKAFFQKMFPTEDEDVPSVRFKGYNEKWTSTTLGSIGKTFTGLSGKTKKDFGHGEAEFITYKNIFNNAIADTEGTENVEIDAKQNEVHFGDALFTTSSETPEEVGMSSVWLDSRKNVYLNSFCFGFRPHSEIDQLFLAFFLRSPLVRRKIAILAQGISRYNISKKKVMKLEVKIPSLKEQQKIGNFFKELDNSITLQEEKIESLKQMKKAFLQKMFV
ncbi:restriction endonuclease subunit S [Alkalibacterium putridalgicola]|uniref:restriction endonuclease subunit S n=1 Tax=Alkalibacterium putridalgicola TaxID=426703 RepID=UPI0034CF6EAF